MSVKWKGADKLRRILDAAPKQARQKVAAALYQQGEQIMTESKTHYVPVDKGVLRGSGHVKQPKVAGATISVTMGYGGAASAYALVQHEAMDFQHTVGGPKYLERPTMAAAGRVRAAVGKAMEDAL